MPLVRGGSSARRTASCCRPTIRRSPSISRVAPPKALRVNVNVLGEAILSDAEADARMEMLLRAHRAPRRRLRLGEDLGGVREPRRAGVRPLGRADRRALRVLYRAAARHAPRTFVNLDMEEYRDLVADHRRAAPRARRGRVRRARRGHRAAGVPARLARCGAASCASGRSTVTPGPAARLKVRVVKGANLAMERVEAELHGWPQAPY